MSVQQRQLIARHLANEFARCVLAHDGLLHKKHFMKASFQKCSRTKSALLDL